MFLYVVFVLIPMNGCTKGATFFLLSSSLNPVPIYNGFSRGWMPHLLLYKKLTTMNSSKEC